MCALIIFFRPCRLPHQWIRSAEVLSVSRNAAPSLPSEQRAGDGDVRYSVLLKCMHAFVICTQHHNIWLFWSSTSTHLVASGLNCDKLNEEQCLDCAVSSTDSIIIVEKYTNFCSSNLELEYAIVGGTVNVIA